MTKFLLTALISLFLTSAAYALDKNSGDCSACHAEHMGGVHSELGCTDCHARGGEHFLKAADFESGASGCLACHEDHRGITHSKMVTREAEQKFVHKAFNGIDDDFYGKNCSNCHVSSCSDCHGGEHEVVLPKTETCQECHRDYYIGIEYSGLGQRDDHERYQRGPEHVGAHYAAMLPDVHHEAGMSCGECHSMASLSAGEKFSKTCTDCHSDPGDSPEHAVNAHMEKMECYTCHSAWANQEYGTFWLKFENTGFDDFFKWVKRPHIDYAKSSHTKYYSEYPIAVNSKGKYSPVRPEYVIFHTFIKDDKVVGVENRMLTNYYKNVFPHTVRRETVMCESCHESGKRFMRVKKSEQIFDLQKDGLLIDSFYNSRWFRVSNGRFVNDEEFAEVMKKSPEYRKLAVRKWKSLADMLNAK